MSFAFFKSQIVTMSTPASIDQLRESFNLRCEQFSMWTTNKLWLKSRTWITIMTSKRNETKRRLLWLPRSDLGPKKDGLVLKEFDHVTCNIILIAASEEKIIICSKILLEAVMWQFFETFISSGQNN